MKRAAFLLMLAACRTSYEAEGATHATTSDVRDMAQETDTHVVDAPDKTTTTIEEFAKEVVPSEPESVSGATATPGVVTQPGHGPLVKRTVIVAEHGAVTTDIRADVKSQERADSTLDEQHSEKRTFDFLHGPFALIGGIVLIGGAAFAAFKLLKPRLL